MLQPFPHESGVLAGFPVPKSRPSSSTPASGTMSPAASKTLVLPASVCNHPVIMGAQGADVQSGFALPVDVVMEVLDVETEVLAVVVVVPLEPEVALVADEELLLLDSAVLVVDEVCCSGLITTNTSAPATTKTPMTTSAVILEFDNALVRSAAVT